MSITIGSMFKWWKEGRSNGDWTSAAAGNGKLTLPSSLSPPWESENAGPAEPPWLAALDHAGYPRHLTYPSTTLGRILDQTADRFGGATAIIYNHKKWTYRELAAEANRMAGGLARLGVRRNERVVMTLPNCPEFIISFFAIQKLGAVVVNAGPLLGADDLRSLIAMTSPRVVIGLDLRAPLLAGAGRGSTVEHWVWVSLQSYQSMLRRLGYQWELWQRQEAAGNTGQHLTLAQLLADAPAKPPTLEPSPDATAVLQPTGGTTGSLKLAQLTHRSLLANAMQILIWMKSPIGQERVLSALPMFHVFGLSSAMIYPVFAGATMILMTRFTAAEAIELIEHERPTLFPLVPAICDAISDALERRETPAVLRGLRLCISGAAPLGRETGQRFERLTGAGIIEGYGLTEASPVTHANPPGGQRYGSIGIPMPDTECRVVELDDPSRDVSPGQPGELLVSGPQLMIGYFANPDESHRVLTIDENGRAWLHTADVVRVDEQGYFHVLDRNKDLIIHSGLKIYPSRVEHVLLTCPGISDAAVVGQADAVHTELVVAFVVSKDIEQDREALALTLRALCREHLAPYEVPARFEFMQQIPRSPLGKVLRKDLRGRPATVAEGNGAAAGVDEDGNDPDRHAPHTKPSGKEAA
jgi:long-chain acyl-CoA synthetase